MEGTRSYPNPRMIPKNTVGVKVHNEGPLHLHGIVFKNFGDDEVQKGCAIKFRDNFEFGMGSSSSVKGNDTTSFLTHNRFHAKVHDYVFRSDL